MTTTRRKPKPRTLENLETLEGVQNNDTGFQ